MDQIIIIPKTEKQSSVIQAFLREMKIRFNTKSDDTQMSEEEFYAKIDESIKQAEEGKVETLSKEQQKEMLGL